MQAVSLTLDSRASGEAYAWAVLDEPADWEGFSRTVAGREGCWESFLAIDGMHCAACSLTVEAALARLPGVDSVRVNGVSAIARLVWSPGAAARRIGWRIEAPVRGRSPAICWSPRRGCRRSG
jgi:Cu2+-exporting ATPase